MANIFTDDGHYLNESDSYEYVKWKVEELISIGYSEDCIINFRDDNGWSELAKNILTQIKQL